MTMQIYEPHILKTTLSMYSYLVSVAMV